MEKLDKVIRALEMHEGAKGGEVSCVGCPYEEYMEYCLTVLHKDALEVIEDLRTRLDDAKNGRLELARKYQALKAERDDLCKDIEAQGEIILELNRDLKRCREALNAQGEYEYLGGDLISREALIERIENVDWYHEDECGKSTVMRQGACSEEEAWFKAPDIFAAVRDALAVEAEPVVHAHWVYKNGCWFCSHCDGEMLYEIEEYGGGMFHDVNNVWPPRCPYCGAHMNEGVAE